MNVILDGIVTAPLGSERAAEVHQIVSGCCNENVVPPGFSFSYEDAAEWFSTKEDGPYAEFSDVVGVMDELGALEGVIVLQPFELDGRPCLEFMIFFRESSRGKGTPLLAAGALLSRLRIRCDAPVITPVNERNTKGKRFYERAGFEFDRRVLCEGFMLELWRLKDNTANAPV